MQSVIVQEPAQAGGGVPKSWSLGPGDGLTLGRDPDADLVLDHPGVPRQAARIEATSDFWLLTNLGRELAYVVENPEGGGEFVRVGAGRSRAPIPFEFARISMPIEGGTVDVLVFAPEHDYGAGVAPDGEPEDATVRGFALDEDAKYFRVLVALCEPRLRDAASAVVPGVGEVAEQLGLSRSAAGFHIDYLARYKLHVYEREDAEEPEARLDQRRQSLVATALRFGLVTPTTSRCSSGEGSAVDPLRGVPLRVEPGTKVGAYVLGERLGAGAWGTVHAATAADGAKVAIKLVPATAVDPALADRIGHTTERELELASRRLDGLMELHEVIRLDDAPAPLTGGLALVMPLARTSLAELIADAGDGKPIADADRVVGQLWDALDTMHAAGWVHADVKASNVLVMDDGSVRLADFGLAAELDGTHAYVAPLGPPDAVPPEWWDERAGASGATARPARDLWALGVLAHQALTGGRHPFPGQTPRARALRAQAYAGGNEPLRLDPAVPERWQPTIATLLSVDPAERAKARRPGTPPPRPRRRGRIAAALAALVVVLGGGGAAIALSGGDDDTPAPAPTAAQRKLAAIGGELAPDAPVPARYRRYVVAAAHNCAAAALTPSLVAGILSVESNFDAKMRRPAKDEYGIAGWTPRVFANWKNDIDGGGSSVFSPADSIIAVGSYLCASLPTIAKVPGDRGPLLAAVYANGTDAVLAAKGVPPQSRAFVDGVMKRARAWGSPVS